MPASPAGQRETRVIAGSIEVRASESGPPRITGYAAVFDEPSLVIEDWLGSFVERIAPTAFDRTLGEGADVRALLNHDPNWILGRNTAGTLTLKTDKRGLFAEITPPDNERGRYVIDAVTRGDIHGMSFSFRTMEDRWTFKKGADPDERELLDVDLFDVGPTPFPAYPATTASARSVLAAVGVDLEAVVRVCQRARRGAELAEADHDLIRRAIETLRGFLPADPAPAAAPVAVLRRQLDLAAIA